MKNLSRILIAIVVMLIMLGSSVIYNAKGINYFFSHLEKVLLAVIVFVFFALIPYKYYRKISKYLLVGIIAILFLTFIFAPSVKGAARWINLGVIKFQPSEFAKIILLMHLSVLIEQKGEIIKDFKNGLRYMLFWIGAVVLLIFLQPNVSTTIIIALTSFVLLFVGGARIFHLGSIVASLLLIGGSAAMSLHHSRVRILTFIHSITKGGYINLQVLQSKIALGSGGLLGLGLGHSRQVDLFLPESHNDFIFSVLGEELGFFGALIILLAYLSIFIVGLLIAKRAKDDLGQLLAFGISFTIVFSAFIHVAVGVGLIPTTGITLPFISFGGTSIIIFSISIGILINIARYAQKHQEHRRARARA